MILPEHFWMLWAKRAPFSFIQPMKRTLSKGLPRSGSFIETEGRVRFSHNSCNPSDHPNPEELLSALEMI
jgi:hypothetical protein